MGVLVDAELSLFAGLAGFACVGAASPPAMTMLATTAAINDFECC
jgi:hypothetical protein